MDTYTGALESIINSFTDVDELNAFAVFWNLQETPVVRLRLFQLRNPQIDNDFIMEQLDNVMRTFDQAQGDSNLELALEFVKEQEEKDEIEKATRVLEFDDEMDSLAQDCINDGEWNPLTQTQDRTENDMATANCRESRSLQTQDRSENDMATANCRESRSLQEESRNEEQPEPSHRMDTLPPVQYGSGDEPQSGPSQIPDTPQTVQRGRGDEPRPGPSHRPDTPPAAPGLNYTCRQKTKRTYAKNAAVDTCYEVKVDDQHHGQRLNDIREGLHDMFDDVLDQARGNLAGNDLGRVIIQHDDLHDPIVVPLQPWDQLNADRVMETIEKVLNSHQNLSVDESFDITVGSVDLPKGGARRRITKLSGKKNSINLKKSIVTIVNNDKLCMARAISVSWAKQKRCTPSEWKDITNTRGAKSNLQLI